MNTFSSFADHRKGIGMIVIAAILWSTGGLFIKWSQLNAFQISALRSIFTVLTFYALFRGKVFTTSIFTFVNGVFYAAILVLFVIATKETTAANAIFLQYTAPIYVLLLEPFLLKTKLRMINIVTIIFCFLGMTLFFVGKLSPGNFHGNLVAIASGVAFAAFLLGMRKNKPEQQAASIFWGNILIMCVCSYSLFNGGWFNSREILITGYLGIFQIGLAYAAFTFGLKRVEAIEASMVSMIEPVLNPVWVFIGVGESPSVYAILGGIVIITTIGIRTYFVERERAKNQLPRST